MRFGDRVGCRGMAFGCAERHAEGFADIDCDPALVSVVLISEAAPTNPQDGYYAGPQSLFERTTVLAFREAGEDVESARDLLHRGVYLTTAVKCPKKGPTVAQATIEACSEVLERELSLFPNVRAYLLMGDVAIRAANLIAQRREGIRAIPPGSTYRIRGGKYYLLGARAFPSYLQAGPAYFIEKSKRAMIAEDIAAALDVSRAVRVGRAR